MTTRARNTLSRIMALPQQRQSRLEQVQTMVTAWWPSRPVRIVLHMAYRQFVATGDLLEYNWLRILLSFFIVDVIMTYTARLLWWFLCGIGNVVLQMCEAWMGLCIHVTLWLHWVVHTDWLRTARRFAHFQFTVVSRESEWTQYKERAQYNRQLDLPDGAALQLLTANEFWPNATYISAGRGVAIARCDTCKMRSLQSETIIHLAGLNFHVECAVSSLDNFLYERYRLMRLGDWVFDMCNLLTLCIERFCVHHVRHHDNTLALMHGMRSVRHKWTHGALMHGMRSVRHKWTHGSVNRDVDTQASTLLVRGHRCLWRRGN